MDMKAREQLKRDIDFANDYITMMKYMNTMFKYGISTFGVFIKIAVKHRGL
jgi:hypothetical protein